MFYKADLTTEENNKFRCTLRYGKSKLGRNKILKALREITVKLFTARENVINDFMKK